ncbi:MAG: TVP38/TMEM64 family protein [Acidobacteria bacterium]|nr:TVP38/TMEM64 family protein [Acidobacteriota bacterium]
MNHLTLGLSTGWKRVLIAALFLSALGLFYLLGGGEWLTLEAFKQNRARLLELASRHYWLFFIAWGVAYATAIALSIPGASVLSLATGFLFGRILGTLLVVLSATLGGTLVFLGARYLFADAARRRLEKNPTAARLIQGFHANAFHYLLFLRLVPVFPFWLVNLVPAFTPISIRTYVLATALGIIPGSFVFVNLGRSLSHIERLDDLLSAEVLLSLGLLGGLALLPVAVKGIKGKEGRWTQG